MRDPLALPAVGVLGLAAVPLLPLPHPPAASAAVLPCDCLELTEMARCFGVMPCRRPQCHGAVQAWCFRCGTKPRAVK